MKVTFRDEHAAPVQLSGIDDLIFDADFCQFAAIVTITDCRIRALGLLGTYFLGGLRLERCVVESWVNFQSGGHNRYPIEVVDTLFLQFVDVEDCWFECDVVLRRVEFRAGANFLGNRGTPMAVQYDGVLLCEGVIGAIERDTWPR